ncbi:Methyltransferase domain-containing protein [Nonlabens sp. Hel1_33_55]|uniref:class I SAM-dependent methyltransferase n=1 Tax=Nonlabens sp. Hel1_33_55 TaxID=1336802 RepID=UPI000875BAFB|nr:class I SAM-dependent methyltransferase [Nonlabens sp. Hel1_33_55]SCX92546.1 Methyltransferase domain-containing protein [Nonlabens sp. Hel1_33_55]
MNLLSLFKRVKFRLYSYKKKVKTITVDRLLANDFYFKYEGYCNCCDQKVTFSSRNSWLRDYFFCDDCKSIPRERALMRVIEEEYPNWRSLKIHESSPGNRGTSLKLKKYAADYSCSQYFPNHKNGSQVNNWMNQNLEDLTFEDNSFDLIITQDVLEHVFNPAKAFQEIGRVLKRGGAHIFTVPLVNKHQKTERWATIDENGELNFLGEPEWHGNVVDPNGSPVTMHWGFDIIEFIKKYSNLNTKIFHIDDLSNGIRAELIEVLVTRKS